MQPMKMVAFFPIVRYYSLLILSLFSSRIFLLFLICIHPIILGLGSSFQFDLIDLRWIPDLQLDSVLLDFTSRFVDCPLFIRSALKDNSQPTLLKFCIVRILNQFPNGF